MAKTSLILREERSEFSPVNRCSHVCISHFFPLCFRANLSPSEHKLAQIHCYEVRQTRCLRAAHKQSYLYYGSALWRFVEFSSSPAPDFDHTVMSP